MDFFKEKRRSYPIIGGIVALVVLGLGAFWFFKEDTKEVQGKELLIEELEKTETTKEEKIEKATDEIATIFVDIKGAVKNPGVYELKNTARVFDGIEAAGGFLEDADIKKVNQAKRLEDQGQLYIRKIGEEVEEEEEIIEKENNQKENDTGKININTSEVGKLQELPGIGAKKAQAIIDYRKEKGSFKKIEDLMEVSGIGEGTFTKLKDLITIN